MFREGVRRRRRRFGGDRRGKLTTSMEEAGDQREPQLNSYNCELFVELAGAREAESLGAFWSKKGNDGRLLGVHKRNCSSPASWKHAVVALVVRSTVL